MAIDIEAMSPEAREHFRAIGERYPSGNVLAQADKSLLGLALHAATLARFGFGAEDATDLADARDQLRAEDNDSAQNTSARKTITQNSEDALRTGRQHRLTAITVLESSTRVLLQSGDKAGLSQVQSALSDTRVLDDDGALPRHMQLLQQTLASPTLATVVAGRGGLDTLADLMTSYEPVLAALRDRTGHPSTPVVSERRDVLDGIIVTLARNARAAARRAARALGQPSIATAFELVHIYPPRRRAPVAETPEPSAEPTDPTAPTAPVAEPPAGDITPPQ